MIKSKVIASFSSNLQKEIDKFLETSKKKIEIIKTEFAFNPETGLFVLVIFYCEPELTAERRIKCEA